MQKSMRRKKKGPRAKRSRSDQAVARHMLARMKAAPVRKKLVRNVRSKIRTGVYENDLKWEVAAGRLIADLLGVPGFPI
jgi:hypothetical protein